MVRKKERFNSENAITIDQTSVELGESAVLKLVVGRTPSDNQITITTHIFRSEIPGPVVLLLGGVHGNEINGIEIVNQLVLEKAFSHLKRGSVIAIPLLNVFGFNNMSRDVPDGKDVNRSFPGSSTGSLASRIANTLTKKIMPFVDYAVDCHTGGSARYNYPQIRVTKNDIEALELAKVFASPYTMEKTAIANSFRKIANEMEIPTLVYEAGESIRLDGFCITSGKNGIKNVLGYLDLLEIETNEERQTNIIKKSRWVRASQSGIFIWSKCSGQFVAKGDTLGIIKNPYGTKHITVFSKFNGHIVGHNNASVVNQGDALFHIGLTEDQNEEVSGF